jgi:hypothetical protein
MEAVFHITANEFDESFFNQIKSLLKSKKNLEITIAISEAQSKGILRKETREEYFARLDKAIDNLNKGDGVSFTKEEFEDFSKQISANLKI